MGFADATMPVPPAQRIDESALARWLSDHVAGYSGPLEVAKFRGGQSNPTYLLSAPRVRWVLRKKPSGQLLPSAHAVEREYRVMHALRDTGVPVPRMLGLCEDPGVIGTPFFVMEWVDGRILYDPTLPGWSRAERAALYEDINRVIAALHSVDWAAAGLDDFGKPGNYLARQIDRWTRQYRASETERIEAMEYLIEWLPANVPPGDETALVHGDYRLDNLIVHPTEARVIAVLDWELATLGHPLADLAYYMMAWRLAPSEFRGMREADFAALGIPDEAGFQRLYCSRTGRGGIAHWDFHLAYNMFRMAGILQGVYRRALDGNAAAPDALEAGRRARPMAEAGWRVVQQMVS